jgi:hypothetical protein
MKREDFRRELVRVLDRTADVVPAADRLVAGYVADVVDRDVEVHDGDASIDLAALLVLLAQARSNVDLPQYRRRRQATVRSDETVVSAQHRHGPVTGLTSNQAVWSFGVVIDDANVMTADQVGRPRNFMLQDLDGEFHAGWSEINFSTARFPEQARRAFDGAEMVNFTSFVSESRWAGIYSRRHLLAKAVEAKIADEQRFLKAERKRLFSGRDQDEAPVFTPVTKVGAVEKIEVWAFETKVEVEMTGQYPEVPTDDNPVQWIEDRLHRLNSLQRTVRFCIRATEFAFWRDCVARIGFEPTVLLDWLRCGDSTALRVPAWSGGAWTTGIKETPKARTFWARLDQPEHPGLLVRAWRKTETVAADSED